MYFKVIVVFPTILLCTNHSYYKNISFIKSLETDLKK